MSNPSSSVNLADHLFRHEAGKMIAVLTRIFGIHNLEMVEDVVQEAFLKAVRLWTHEKIPDNPSAWLMTVAKNKAVDIIRSRQNFRQYSSELAERLETDTEASLNQFFLESEIQDSQLQMIFACCHPSLKEEDQVALTLKAVSGFGVSEIAKALLTQESAIAKRIYRAKQFLKENNIQLEIPVGRELSRRLDTVYTVLYLLFNEGYNSIKTDELIRKDLCAEAMRLCLLLSQHSTGNRPEAYALLSLMCFQASRFNSRLSDDQSIITLQRQDRTKWDRDLIAVGYRYLNASSKGDTLSIYHIESAIAAEHAMATTFDETNWQRMLELYDLLLLQKNTDFVRLNRAVVLAQVQGAGAAINAVLSIDDVENLLDTNYMYSAVMGDLCQRAGRNEDAINYYLKAYSLTNSNAEKNLLAEKMKTIKG